ncbi:TlpA family protein disulfide reductase [bacterium]|nr:TlpA family protein disulfide reductase [bacterium]
MNALSRRLRPAIALVAPFVTLLVLASGAAADDESYSRAPAFRAVDLDGERFTLDDLLGKGPILVDFWATWCKPCIKELPYVQRIHDDLADAGVQVLAVTVDSPKSQSQVRKFIKSRKFTFRVVMDGEQDVFRKLQGKGTVPYVVVLDAEGNIRYHHTGYRPGDEKELRRVVEELLAEGEAEAIDTAAREAEEAG